MLRRTSRLSGAATLARIGQNAEKLRQRIRNLRGFADVMGLTSIDAG
jgi:hypothetical protein